MHIGNIDNRAKRIKDPSERYLFLLMARNPNTHFFKKYFDGVYDTVIKEYNKNAPLKDRVPLSSQVQLPDIKRIINEIYIAREFHTKISNRSLESLATLLQQIPKKGLSQSLSLFTFNSDVMENIQKKAGEEVNIAKQNSANNNNTKASYQGIANSLNLKSNISKKTNGTPGIIRSRSDSHLLEKVLGKGPLPLDLKTPLNIPKESVALFHLMTAAEKELNLSNSLPTTELSEPHPNTGMVLNDDSDNDGVDFQYFTLTSRS